MKKCFVFLFIVLILINVGGCSNITLSPKGTLSRYLDAFLHGRLEEAYQYISTNDKKMKSLDEYLSEELEVGEDIITQTIIGKISYEIKETTVSEKQANAEVAVTMPDIAVMHITILGGGSRKDREEMLQEVYTDMYREKEFSMLRIIQTFVSLMSIAGNKDIKELNEVLVDKYEKKGLPMITITKEYNLVNEPEGWKIFFNWQAEKIAEEMKNKIDELFLSAEKLKEEGKLYGALAEYNKVIKLKSEKVESKPLKKEIEQGASRAKQKLPVIKKEISKYEEKQAYIKNVELYDFTAAYYKQYFEPDIVGVKFKIKNNGNKTLSEIKVTVYFKDASGAEIAEEDYHPVVASSYFSKNSKPLKSNYIWRFEEGKFYPAKSVPSEWDEGSATAEITDIEFEK